MVRGVASPITLKHVNFTVLRPVLAIRPEGRPHAGPRRLPDTSFHIPIGEAEFPVTLEQTGSVRVGRTVDGTGLRFSGDVKLAITHAGLGRIDALGLQIVNRLCDGGIAGSEPVRRPLGGINCGAIELIIKDQIPTT